MIGILGYKIILIRKAFYRGIKISIKPDLSITITTSKLYEYNKIVSFVNEKKAWIEKAIYKIKSRFNLDNHKIHYLNQYSQYLDFKDGMFALKRAKLTQDAKALLSKKLELFAKQTGNLYTLGRFGNNSTVWGSCSYNNRINLNIKLILLPEHLIDYVINHEIAHIKHKNHSARFWNYLDSISPNAKKHAKEIKQFAYILQL